MSGIKKSVLVIAFVGLFNAVQAPAWACDIAAAGRSVVSISDYNPVASAPQRREFTVALRGRPGQITWLQIQSQTSTAQLDLVFEAQTQNGLRNVSGIGGRARALDPASLSHFWAPVVFDAGGQAQAQFTVSMPTGQQPTAGLHKVGFEAIIACEGGGQVREAITPVDLGSVDVRVPTLIAVSQRGGAVLDFGTIPLRNSDGYSPQSARSAFDVVATGGFSVEIEGQNFIMRNQDIKADGRLDAIAYELHVSDDRGSATAGVVQKLRCGPALGGQTLTIAASLFANAATGKLAGRYRDTVKVLVSPAELNGLLAGQCVSGTE